MRQFCKNASIPESTLQKKIAIAYHLYWEAVASGMIRVAWEGTETNLSDLFTKTKSNNERDRYCINSHIKVGIDGQILK